MIQSKRCSIEGCDGKYRCKGFCEKHYIRYNRHGDPNILIHDTNKKYSVKELFNDGGI